MWRTSYSTGLSTGRFSERTRPDGDDLYPYRDPFLEPQVWYDWTLLAPTISSVSFLTVREVRYENGSLRFMRVWEDWE